MRIRRTLTLFSLLIATLITLIDVAQAQNNGKGTTQAGYAAGRPAGSYQLSEIENINLFNGRLNITIPLVTAKGRGDTTLPVNVSINSPVWRTEEHPNPDPNNNHPAIFGVWDPGFTIGSMPKVEQRMSYDHVSVCGGATTRYEGTLTRMYVTMPDGTEYEFRDAATDGEKLNPSGCVTWPNRGKVFVTKDGSFMTFVADADVYDGQYGPVTTWPAGTLYTADGTVFRFDNGAAPSWIRDRNGNVSSYGGSAGIHTITDSLGREIEVNSQLTASLSASVGFKGTGGSSREITIDGSELSDVLISGESLASPNQLFNGDLIDYGGGSENFNPDVVSEITLPNGLSYEFEYNRYGEVARIEMPTGAVVEYDWANGIVGGSSGGYTGDIGSSAIYRRLVERRIYEDGSNLTSKLTISRPESTGGSPYTNAGYVETKTYEGSNVIAHEKRYFHGAVSDSFLDLGTRYTIWNLGKEYKTEQLSATGSVLTTTLQEWRQTNPAWWTACGSCDQNKAPVNDPKVVETIRELNDVSPKLVSKSTSIDPSNPNVLGFDQFNNRTDVWEYDWGSGSAGAFLRRTHTDFVSSTSYTSHTGSHIRSLPLESWISSDAAGSSKVSLTEYEYDNYSTDSNHAGLISRSSVTAHDTTNFGTGFAHRGNLTAVTSYANASAETGAVTSYSQYDILGNVVKTIDANVNSSTIDYADNFGSPDGDATTNTTPSQITGYNTFAFPTSTTNPMNWSASIQFDYFTGAPVNTQDVNGVISKTIYNDPLDRPTQTVEAIGTEVERQSTIDYDDEARRVETTGDRFTLNDNLVKTEAFYDRLGRTTKEWKYSDGDYVSIETKHDALGRVVEVSNPYRPARQETAVWTKTEYDALGRAVEIETPDTARALTSYRGNRTLVTDQAGKQRISKTDALGRLKEVWEVLATSQSGSATVTFPGTSIAHGFKTDYSYNTLGKMIHVEQGVQHRYFMHDGLGRLIRVRQPEQEVNTALNTSGNPNNNSWTIGFTHDNNGNVLTSRDANNVVITSTYDALSRPITRSYSDSTPTVTYTYDDNEVAISKGKLTKVSSSISEMRYTEYDETGRLLSSEQATDGQVYPSSYNYNLRGALIEQTYPSGRVVQNVLDNSGDISIIRSRKNQNFGYWNYAQSFEYTPSGVIKHLRLGNGLWESAVMNSRNQVLQLRMGNSPTDASRMHLTYEYGEFDQNGNVDVTKNAGNIARQTIDFDGLAHPLVQEYLYDSLDRITEAKETAGGTQTWIQNFGYDRYGNRTSHSQTVLGQSKPINETTLPSIDAYTNRFSNTSSYDFDAVGNLIRDAAGREFTFNGDNKQVKVEDSEENTLGEYRYDGLRKRIKKITDSETVVFVYDGLGKLIEEYSTASPPQNPMVHYTATDPLGSPRVLTNEYGAIVSRRDFMPFGEEIEADTTYRTATLKYGVGDNVRQKFTGYQRDEETDLDFAEARYYFNNHGRFTAVDPLLASGKSADPQTFNRYVYAINKPLILIDPTGLQAGREISFGIRHPLITREIGTKATEYGNNIASNATRFANNSDFNNKRGLTEVTEINALRHTILSAAITVRFGEAVAKDATDSHEEDDVLPSSQTGSMEFSNERTADKEADLRNNEVGREIGKTLPGNSTMKDVAVATLNHFRDKGLNVLQKNANGTVTVVSTKIGQTQVNNTLKEWSRREDGTGYSPEARKKIEDSQKPIKQERVPIQ